MVAQTSECIPRLMHGSLLHLLSKQFDELMFIDDH